MELFCFFVFFHFEALPNLTLARWFESSAGPTLQEVSVFLHEILFWASELATCFSKPWEVAGSNPAGLIFPNVVSGTRVLRESQSRG